MSPRSLCYSGGCSGSQLTCSSVCSSSTLSRAICSSSLAMTRRTWSLQGGRAISACGRDHRRRGKELSLQRRRGPITAWVEAVKGLHRLSGLESASVVGDLVSRLKNAGSEQPRWEKRQVLESP